MLFSSRLKPHTIILGTADDEILECGTELEDTTLFVQNPLATLLSNPSSNPPDMHDLDSFSEDGKEEDLSLYALHVNYGNEDLLSRIEVYFLIPYSMLEVIDFMGYPNSRTPLSLTTLFTKFATISRDTLRCICYTAYFYGLLVPCNPSCQDGAL